MVSSNLLLCHFARELLKQTLLLRVQFVQMMELSGRECRANSFATISVWGMALAEYVDKGTETFIDTFKLFFSRAVFPWLICLSVLTVLTSRTVPQNDLSYDKSI